MKLNKNNIPLIGGTLITLAWLGFVLTLTAKGAAEASVITEDKVNAVMNAVVANRIVQNYAGSGDNQVSDEAIRDLLKSSEYTDLKAHFKLTSKDQYAGILRAEAAINAKEKPTQQDAVDLFSSLALYSWATTLRLSLLSEQKAAPAYVMMDPLFALGFAFAAFGVYLIGYGSALRKTKAVS